MLILLIETCTERGVIALFDDFKPLFVEQLPVGLQNSQALLPAIAKGFKQIQKETSDLDLVIAGVGPGSYTGIRVGVAAAKAIAFAHQLPLVGVSTLFGLVPDSDGSYAAVIDAKIGGAYYLIGKRHQQHVYYHGEPAIAEIVDLKAKLAEVDVLVTPKADPLRRRLGDAPKEWTWCEKAPDPQQMVRIGEKQFKDGLYSLHGHLDILYLRKTQAEIDQRNALGS